MAERNLPQWLNLDAVVGPKLVDDLAKIRAEAEALAPTVRDFARRAFRATQSYDAALVRAMLPDEVRELVSHRSGAEATFEAIGRMVDDLKVAWLEKPDNAVWPDWFEEEAAKVPETGFTTETDR